MSDTNDRAERRQAFREDQLRRAERIGRLAADEGLSVDEAHALADRTAILALPEQARHEREVRARWMQTVLAVTLVAIVGRLIVQYMAGELDFGLSLLGSITVVVVLGYEVFIGNPIDRIASLLPARLGAWAAGWVRDEVMVGYNEQLDILGMRGCGCPSHQP